MHAGGSYLVPMKWISAYTAVLFCLLVQPARSQDSAAARWWNPAVSSPRAIEGQAWPEETGQPYGRLPARAEKSVSAEVWNLSQQAAGLVVRFKTNAEKITVRYQVAGPQAMPHMPATGVSGVDLYGIDAAGTWLWCAGKWAFKDTIEYNFSNLQPEHADAQGIEYRLYLPLYNTVRWLEIGVPLRSKLAPLPARKIKPIVVYGTSIAQGACASRPGMAWTAILSRRLDLPVINLGFSGAGRLDPEMTKLITEVPARVFVLDCLPNLVGGKATFTETDIYDRLMAAVKQIRAVQARTPIILTDHFGYTDAPVSPVKRALYKTANRINHQVVKDLAAQGVGSVYLLPVEQLQQDADTMVDGIHPSDLGMMRYAAAYEALIKMILNGKPFQP